MNTAPRLWAPVARVALAAFFTAASVTVVGATAPDARDGANFSRHFDIRQAEGHPDHLGLDFDLRWARARDDPRDPRTAYSILALAKGFQTFDRKIPDANSMAAELGLQGSYYATNLTKLSEPEVRRHRELSERGFSEDSTAQGLTPAEQSELEALSAAILKPDATLWTYDLHFRVETNHDASRSQQVFGVGGALELPLLHRLLDLVPSTLRAPAYQRPQPVRVYLAGEYVAPEQDSTLAFASGRVDRLWRMRMESAWRTRVLPGVDLRAEARADWLPSAPKFVREAGRDVNAFVQVWLLMPLSSGNSGVMIKYFDGRLAPGYGSLSGGKVGLTIDFAKP